MYSPPKGEFVYFLEYNPKIVSHIGDQDFLSILSNLYSNGFCLLNANDFPVLENSLELVRGGY